ncbi:four-carbon acid sugar kinase family protein [Bosea sp. BH3]|uniref:four-carbon acid sugar kinase family protein n=1 Tax=Bosea sp. BH3 TaxID=2871701 RepID=UPI0021CB6EBA|nr:four-carbon acid sugar kinase family protein [Bosea sp. BH3]MCU4180812.1 four-carbon acid sugar kinase family protein [Bosea sp. BH3]
MANAAPQYGWFGDDFTGASDTLATLAERGFRALLFLGIPTPEQLAAVGPLDAVGIAGATRSMAPAEMTPVLDAAGAFFAGLGVRLMHYKCCSTFDSAPHVGSIGAAVAALGPHFPNPLVPVIGGQPNLGRYCLFGQLFAAAGTGGEVHRIDRHPTMSRHPVTPMGEADLRRHLAAQGLGSIGLLDYRSYEDEGGAAALERAGEAQAVLFDVSRPEDLAAIGRLVAGPLADAPMLAVGASSVAQMVAGLGWATTGAASLPAVVRPEGPVLALAGSLSPVTRAQVEAATGFARVIIDPARLLSEPGHADDLCRRAVSQLAAGDTMLLTAAPEGAPENPRAVAEATGALLRDVMREARVARLLVAGGDTSTLAIEALDIWGLSYRAPLVAGAPLCRAHSAAPHLDGLDIVLKGGQMGPPNFFELASR